MRGRRTIKKLGEIAHFPTRRVSSLLVDAENYVGVDNLVKDRGGKVKATIVPSKGSCTEYKNGDILLGNIRPYLKKIWLANNDGGASGDVLVVRPNNPFEIIPAFLCWCLSADVFFEYDTLHSKGAKMPRGNKADILNYEVSIPPIRLQEMAIAELDTLSKVISKKKQQLEELDKLSQSIFYDMFGDISTNGRGFPTQRISDLGELARGVSKYRPRNAPELLGGEMPLIQTGDVANADKYIRSYSSTYSQKGIEQSRIWEENTICITIAANIGNCAILPFQACFPDSVVGFIHNEKLGLLYAYFVFANLHSILEEKAMGIAQKNINLKILNDLMIPVPSLDLQNEFAQRIEAIEKQKDLVKQSIGETETLFNSRMDYWFS